MSSAPKQDPAAIHERLSFAQRRMEELLALNNGNLAGAEPAHRQQLIQEFFFHLVGAIEFVAQLANDRRSLGMSIDDVTVPKVAAALSGDPLEPLIKDLHASVRAKPLPTDPYSDDGLLFRVWNYRHQVTHRHRNPFHFAQKLPQPLGPPVGYGWRPRVRRLLRRQDPIPPSAHFHLDPRVGGSTPSNAATAG